MKILILAAMDKEMALLSGLLENGVEYNAEGASGVAGRISGHEVLLAKCGIGKVNAALNAYKLITAFGPELVINSGVAGGAGGMKIGQLLVAGKVGYYDVWCGPGTERGAADGYARLFAPCRRVIEIAKKELGEDGVNYGLIATGDVFVSTAEEIQFIHSIYPEAVAVDMESAAIAQTCAMTGVEFNIIRVVSDTPGAGENISQYKNFWQEAPARTFGALRTILAHL
ncbi:MAG: 5'-methylthioadenosine/S-adenosylhomocysteine nucleosidase [Muribaculaceae bacterium]|nr:5'-methylthioadenosine/S-adenosylhomocysteine nucleosidase [Muribaculaceae bacterium]